MSAFEAALDLVPSVKTLRVRPAHFLPANNLMILDLKECEEIVTELARSLPDVNHDDLMLCVTGVAEFAETAHSWTTATTIGSVLTKFEYEENVMFSDALDSQEESSQLTDLKTKMLISEIASMRLIKPWRLVNEIYSCLGTEYLIEETKEHAENSKLEKNITNLFSQATFSELSSEYQDANNLYEGLKKIKEKYGFNAVGHIMQLVSSIRIDLSLIRELGEKLPSALNAKDRCEILIDVYEEMIKRKLHEEKIFQVLDELKETFDFYIFGSEERQKVKEIFTEKNSRHYDQAYELMTRAFEFQESFTQSKYDANGAAWFNAIPYPIYLIQLRLEMDGSLNLGFSECLPDGKTRGLWMSQFSLMLLRYQVFSGDVYCPFGGRLKHQCETGCTSCWVNDYLVKAKKLSKIFPTLEIPSRVENIIRNDPQFEDIKRIAFS